VNFGFNFVLMMAVAYVLIKGSLHGILGLVKLSYCKKTLKIDGTQCQTLDTIARTPWSMKGLTVICYIVNAHAMSHRSDYAVMIGVAGVIGVVSGKHTKLS
jgi:hypothetical protein